jgi:hypothetical protein
MHTPKHKMILHVCYLKDEGQQAKTVTKILHYFTQPTVSNAQKKYHNYKIWIP